MLDDILEEIFGEIVVGPSGRSKRGEFIARLFFGLLGAGLGGFGAVHFALQTGLTNNLLLRLGMIGVFVFLACFSLFNVALARTWRWPGRLFVASFVLLIVARIVLGP